MSLIIPGEIHNVHNTQAIFKVYDPNKIAGDNTPYIPKPVPPPKEASSGGGCGILGTLLIAVVAITFRRHGCVSELAPLAQAMGNVVMQRLVPSTLSLASRIGETGAPFEIQQYRASYASTSL